MPAPDAHHLPGGPRLLEAVPEAANARRHEYTTLKHLLLALTDNGDAATMLRACGVADGTLRCDLAGFLDRDLADLVRERRICRGDHTPREY